MLTVIRHAPLPSVLIRFARNLLKISYYRLPHEPNVGDGIGEKKYVQRFLRFSVYFFQKIFANSFAP